MSNKYIISIILSILSIICCVNTALSKQAGPAGQLISDGRALFEKGDFEHAAQSWEQAIGFLKGNSDVYIDVGMHLANAYQALGYHRKALSTLGRALPVLEKSKDRKRKALFMNTLADIHLSLGNMDEMAKHITAGLEEAHSAESPRILARVLNNLGNVLAVDTFYQEALVAYGECLEITGDSKDDRELKARVAINITRTVLLGGDYESALPAINHALIQTESLPDTHNKASHLVSLARLIREIQQKLPQSDKNFTDSLTRVAHKSLHKAGQIAKALKDIRMISYSSGYMGNLYEDKGSYPEAMKLTRRAIFFAQQGNFPEILYRWQWQLGRLLKAGGDIEKAVKAYRDAIKILEPIRRELFKGYRSQKEPFDEEIKPVYLGLAELLLNQAAQLPEGKTREEKLRQAMDAMELLKTAELQNFFHDECSTVMQSKIERVDRTPAHTAVIYPIPLPKQLSMLLILPDGMEQTTVDVDSARLKETITRFRGRLQNRTNNRFLYEARELYNWLIRPIEAKLKSHKIDTLVIAPEGSLRLIPFSTLHDGENFLVEKYAMGLIPAISLTDPKPFDSKDVPILISGLSEGVQGFSALPSVKAELHDIKEIMAGDVLLENKEHNIDNLAREFKNNAYTIVHMATHGVFGGTPEDTFLLTYNDKLTMDMLEELVGFGRYREKQVELLTLSACQTALGDERAALGLAGVAVKAGVRSTIATLWFVDDESTSLAIREFYRQLKTPGISKAKALQNAQKKLIGQLRYRHPLYWGPFLLIGNWM